MTEQKQLEDKIKVGEYEIFMSYARLLRIVSIFPNGLTDLTSAHGDSVVLGTVVEILLADKGVAPDDYPNLETYDLSLSQGDEIAEWGLAHAFSFFARKVEATLQSAKVTGELIKSTTSKTDELTKSMLSSNGSAD